MRPIIIGVCGSHSGAGKTRIAELILRNFKGWGAIKYTKTELYSSIIEEKSIILEEGKDTRRLFDAGAEKVIWIKSPVEGLTESIEIAIQSLGNLKGIIIEGNSAVKVAKPDIIVFVVGKDKNLEKESSKLLMESADIIIYYEKIPDSIPPKAHVIKMDDHKNIIMMIDSLLDKLISERK